MNACMHVFFHVRRPHVPREWEIKQIYRLAGMAVPGGPMPDMHSVVVCL